MLCATIDVALINKLIAEGCVAPYEGKNGEKMLITLYIAPTKYERVMRHGKYNVTHTHAITVRGTFEQSASNGAAYYPGTDKIAFIGSAWRGNKFKDADLPY